MAKVKIEIKLGAIYFSSEGDKNWVAMQLDKFLGKALELAKIAPQQLTVPTAPFSQKPPMTPDQTIAQQPLASFLKTKDATTNQTKKFLATAVWLEAKGKNRLTTGDVTKALKDNSQKRLGNASDCLSQNISKGYCERDGKEFFITDEGRSSL